MPRLKSFLIETGNSTKGSVGLCMRVRAYTKQEALDIGNEFLSELEGHHVGLNDLNDGIEYCNVYVAGNLKINSIVSGDTEDVDDKNDDK